MNYTPNDIQNIVFRRAMRGYDEDSVNDVLDKVIEDYSFYIHENIELKDRVGVLSEGIQHYKNIEDSLQETLVIAQQTSEEIKKNAKEKAELIIREAEMTAQSMINEAAKETAKSRFELEELKKNTYMFKLRTESLLKAQLEMMNQLFEENEAGVEKVKGKEKANVKIAEVIPEEAQMDEIEPLKSEAEPIEDADMRQEETVELMEVETINPEPEKKTSKIKIITKRSEIKAEQKAEKAQAKARENIENLAEAEDEETTAEPLKQLDDLIAKLDAVDKKIAGKKLMSEEKDLSDVDIFEDVENEELKDVEVPDFLT